MDKVCTKDKICWYCKNPFPATSEYFYRDKSRPDGLCGRCKDCNYELRRKWRKNNNLPKSPRINRTAENRKYIWNVKEKEYCILCTESRPESLLFHHRESSEKIFSLSKPEARPLSEVKAEIAKCDILCANCHMSLHYWESHK